MIRWRFSLCGFLVSGLLLAACVAPPPPRAGATEAPSETATTEATPGETAGEEAPEAAAVVLTVVESEEYGEYLADAEGRALYLFTSDEGADGSTCTGDCVQAWPPLTVEQPVQVTAGEGVDDMLHDTIERDDGTFQVTYNGWPLYYYAEDEGPDTTEGQSIAGAWFLVTPAGDPIEAGIEDAVEEEGMTPEATEEATGEEMTPEATEEAGEEAITPEATEEAAEATTGTVMTPTVVAEESAAITEANTIEVELISYEIRMPESIPAGPTEFVVTNIGDIEHNFEIEGQGIEREFEENLQPGETQTMQVDLEPGEYHVYCPVGNHAAQGMELTLTVTEQ